MSLEGVDIRIIVGMFLDVPPPGSIKDNCMTCGDVIVIGPDSQEVMRKNKHVHFMKLCMPCTLEATQGAGYTVKQAREVL